MSCCGSVRRCLLKLDLFDMRASNRIIVNTLAQYVRTIINLLLSLYSARLVLDILGVDDYGIYSLVAGVVSMLSLPSVSFRSVRVGGSWNVCKRFLVTVSCSISPWG